MYSLFWLAHKGHIHLYRQYLGHVYKASSVRNPELKFKVTGVSLIGSADCFYSSLKTAVVFQLDIMNRVEECSELGDIVVLETLVNVLKVCIMQLND